MEFKYYAYADPPYLIKEYVKDILTKCGYQIKGDDSILLQNELRFILTDTDSRAITYEFTDGSSITIKRNRRTSEICIDHQKLLYTLCIQTDYPIRTDYSIERKEFYIGIG